MDWHTSGKNWLISVTERLFQEWRKDTSAGKQYENGANPYKCGFFLPDFIDRAIEALNKEDEETFKAIKMVEGFYLDQHREYRTYLNTPMPELK